MKNCRIPILILFLAAAFSGLGADTVRETYHLDNGKIYGSVCSEKSLPVNGKVQVIALSGGVLHYFMIDDEGVPYVGYMEASGDLIEKELPSSIGQCAMEKMEVADSTLFLLGTKDGSKALFRVSLNSMEVSVYEKVSDFSIIMGLPVLLDYDGESFSVHCSDMKVPLMLGGNCKISGSVDDRLVFVSNGSETEVVDVRIGKSVYLYSPHKFYAEPVAFNLQIIAYDTVKDLQETQVYYKVFVDSIYAGRTETGPASLQKVFTHKVDADGYHLVKIERWELEKKSEQYKRSNNIRQPKGVKLFVPTGRILAVKFEFNGTEYSTSSYPLLK